MQPAPSARFSDRVDDYRRYRPSYPGAAVDAVCRHVPSNGRIADLGSGTGVFSALLLERGLTVDAVEPNEPMRQAAEAALGGQPGFTSIAAPAEATTLPDAAVDAVTAAQAFHWFDRARVGAECRRILRPGGWGFILFNERQADTTPFLRDYEALLHTHGTDYAQVDHRRVDDGALEVFFGHGQYESHRFDYAQTLDWDGLAGRVRSSSYVPAAGQPGHDALMEALREAYDAHHEAGKVTIHYDTRLFAGPLRA